MSIEVRKISGRHGMEEVEVDIVAENTFFRLLIKDDIKLSRAASLAENYGIRAALNTTAPIETELDSVRFAPVFGR